MDNLEFEAVRLVQRWNFVLPWEVKNFLRRLAEHLNWPDLAKALGA